MFNPARVTDNAVRYDTSDRSSLEYAVQDISATLAPSFSEYQASLMLYESGHMKRSQFYTPEEGCAWGSHERRWSFSALVYNPAPPRDESCEGIDQVLPRHTSYILVWRDASALLYLLHSCLRSLKDGGNHTLVLIRGKPNSTHLPGIEPMVFSP